MAIVTISQGALKGKQFTMDSGFVFHEFMGIPFAKPPLGELRFKSPQSPEPWDGVRDATTTSTDNISCQIDYTDYGIGGEDCLYLNVYTPKLSADDSKLRAVMVLFHGGGFTTGDGTKKLTGSPDYLVENDVVAVAINYRLGPLGFLSLGIPEAAGNMGLKDQVKALQWIQSNIDKFGGDKDNVTILGMGAGSAACEFLLLSPLAKGLFHKCILQSGSSLNNWAINDPEQAKTTALNLAKKLGYTGSDDNIHAVYKVLFEASEWDIASQALQVARTSEIISYGFVPVIEHDFGNGDAFLLEPPFKLLKEGRYNQVPVIRGFCNNEGSEAYVMKSCTVKKLIDHRNFVDYWPFTLEESDVTKYNSKLKTAYIDHANPNDVDDWRQFALKRLGNSHLAVNFFDDIHFAVNFFGDLHFVAGIYMAGKLQCENVPVYMYKFCYDGKLNLTKAISWAMKKGAAHGDDVGYLLHHYALEHQILDEADIVMRNRMTKMWTNFAKTGNPTPEGCSELPVHWPTFTKESEQYLNIDKDLTIEANHEPEKMSIFEEIMQKYEK